ncbi:adenylyltransferase/cytidyltransferase family protein [Leadbetterella sp. DM7]|uniref:adenylyltransferase/cytidyltransferase family protein n=1 Tax=Leadbetterella sp. DM7 TaxID=3235085 RepID=UPI00349EC951
MNIDFDRKFRIKDLELLNFNYWLLSVRPQQLTIGSLVIALKRSCSNLSDITSEESKELSLVFSKTEKLLKMSFSYNKINYLCLMMVDNQVHFHVFPRYDKPIALDGKSYEDSSWPKPLDLTNVIEEDNIELKVLKLLKEQSVKEKIVVGYTTGVYDLFHIGHLNILRKAKYECDRLIVGVTTDELSLSRKKKTPVIPLAERIEIVKNISFVDEVVHQDTMDKFIAWEKYKFDKMFVGSDWKGTEKWNQMEKDFAKIGVEIVYFPYTESTSSTLLRSVLYDIVK